jgi:exodeoxyribonuclease V beta subunit
MTKIQALEVHRFPLWGSRLIEASAGTGKTWTIASLYLRLVLGHGQVDLANSPVPAQADEACTATAYKRPLSPSQILVMTFTRAATQELSDRIRARLLEAARCFRDTRASVGSDPLLQKLLADYPDATQREWAGWQLEKAAEAMDEAAVMTIDAWCQRMLNEHAFETGNPFDETLLAQDDALLDDAIRDYWRQHCYPLRDESLARVSEVWKDADTLVGSIKPLLKRSLQWGREDQPLASVAEQFIADERAALAQLSRGWVDRVQSLLDWYAAEVEANAKRWDRRQLSAKNVHRWLNQIATWARSPVSAQLGLSEAGLRRLSPEGVRAAYKGDHAEFKLPEAFEALATLYDGLASMPDITLRLRQHAAGCIATRLQGLKQQSRSFSFIDMTQRLETALAGPRGTALRQRIIDQYPVALIDEFQDTSPEQYRLFDTLYRCARSDPDTALILIGDPKQSIYGFRGADVYSYLKAREACADRIYALNVNHRSTREMVAAVNAWFTHAEARPPANDSPDRPGGAFRLRKGQSNAMPFMTVSARGSESVFQTQDGPVAAITIQHDLKLNSQRRSMVEFAARCAEQIVGWLNDDRAGLQNTLSGFTRLRPADIAVLVRTRVEAAAVRRALSVRGLASVFQSDQDSVFASPEASDLLRWLRAIAVPADIALARAALATRTLALPLAELAALAHDEDRFDAAAERLRELNTVWQQRGILAMIRRSLHLFDCPGRWLASTDGERRLTNVLHLAELLQQASAQLDGEQSLIHWFARRIEDSAQGSGDDQVLRLESDADLIQVVTIHKSKGLEYPVVCLPFACSHKPLERQQANFLSLVNASGQRVLRLSFTDEELAQADLERQREDLRLFYVALTRARYAVWMGFAALRQGQKKDCHTHQSAPGYLLAGDTALNETQWLEPLQALARGVHPTIIALQAAPAHTPFSRISRDFSQAPLRAVKPYRADFERRWSVGSYSSIIRTMSSANALMNDSRSPADDERTDTDDTPQPAPEVDAALAAWHRFPGGARAGDFVHSVLEWLATESFELSARPWLTATLQERCGRAGYPRHQELLIHWIQTLLATRLPSLGASLPEVRSRITEMEFWMPANFVRADAVDALCRQYLLNKCDRPALPARSLNGMLMGFADLVFEHEGRYWVLDYKTNRPRPESHDDKARAQGLYARSALQDEMASHRYDVQAAVYLLALHRQLRARLGSSYEPERQLGGAIYWFIRGLDDPARGEYSIAADPSVLQMLEALDHLIGQPEAWS